MKKIWIKIILASMAFAPIPILFIANLLEHEKIAEFIINCCAFFYLPVFSAIGSMIKYSVVSKTIGQLLIIVFMVIWSSFIAWIFWKIAGAFLGEDEPEFETNPKKAKFDWIGFQVRFVIGFICGFLFGWRFVRFSTSTPLLLAAMTMTGLLVGLIFGLYRPNFWRR